MHDVVDHPEPDLRRLSVTVAGSLEWLYVVYRQMLMGRLWMMQCSQCRCCLLVVAIYFEILLQRRQMPLVVGDPSSQ